MAWSVLVTPRSFGDRGKAALGILNDAGCNVMLNPYGRYLTEDELMCLSEDVDGIIAGLDPITSRVLRHGKRLKVISRYGVGIDTVDLSTATELGIVVTNTPGANSTAVAELSLALMLDVARHVSEADREVRGGAWRRYTGVELTRKVLGIVGTGRIGKTLAKLVKGFEMTVLCFDIMPDYVWAHEAGAVYVSLDELLVQSDFISIHVPLVEGTHHLIGEKQLELIKSTSIVVNTSRGGIVDEKALYIALKEGRLAGAGLDVVESEPPLESPLARLDNVVMTSHLGANTAEAVSAMGVAASCNLVDVLQGRIPEHVVNREVLQQ